MGQDFLCIQYHHHTVCPRSSDPFYIVTVTWLVHILLTDGASLFPISSSGSGTEYSHVGVLYLCPRGLELNVQFIPNFWDFFVNMVSPYAFSI